MISNYYTLDLSIVIVNWNTSDLLVNCISSIYKMINKYSFEIIVVDNNSSDDSVKIVKQKFPNVNVLVNNENYGFSKANNIGFSQCSGKYICLLNSDTEIKKKFDELVTFLDLNPTVGIVGPKTLNKDGKLLYTCREFPSLWSTFCMTFGLSNIFKKSKIFKASFMTYFNHDCNRKVNVMSGSCLVVKRKAFEEVGNLDELFYIYGEDVDWCKRFFLNKWSAYFIASAEVYHFCGSSSSAEPLRFSIEMIKSNFLFWSKYSTKFTFFIFKILKVLHYSNRILYIFILFLLVFNKRDFYKIQLFNMFQYFKWTISFGRKMKLRHNNITF